MDVTLRDGSYAIDFSFTSLDTFYICKALEEAGVEYIEIGHGMGFNATRNGHKGAIETDETYLESANSALKTAKFGMFSIAGLALLEDFELGAKYNMGFVRIGADVEKVHEMEPYIKKAKDCGLEVMANFMKSYVMTPEQMTEKVLLVEQYGADAAYIVDSAGCMIPDDIAAFYDAIRKRSGIRLGFHGHDNLGMAIANSFEACRKGYALVDTSLQGLGRSSGNASTEVLNALLVKTGYDTGLDLMKILEIGQKYIYPLMDDRGKKSLDIILGYAEFHSSYVDQVWKCAVKNFVNPLYLILEMSKIDKVNLDRRMMDEVAKKMRREDINVIQYDFRKYIGGEQG